MPVSEGLMLSDRDPTSFSAPDTAPRSFKPHHPLSPKRALVRLMISLGVGAAAAFVQSDSVPWTLRAIVSWDAAAVTMLAQSWAILWSSNATTTEQRASDEDPGGAAVFVIAVVSSLFSLFSTTLSLRGVSGEDDRLWLGLGLLAVALSWTLTHTAYTFRYAHLYYRGKLNGGLQFPGTERPSDLDFAYFAFTVGMCFQVSDVQITNSKIRNAALIHSLIAFLFNTTILAVAMNVVARLIEG
jgi:uncharacterized membrane protein